MYKMIRFRDNTKVYRIILCAIIIVSLFSLTIEVRSNESVNNQIVVEKLIEKNFRDYSLINIEKLDQYTKNYFKKNYANLSPSLINDDFDGNGYLDYAFLLQNKKSKDAKTIFVIFLQQQKNAYNVSQYLNLVLARDDVYIRPVSAGTLVNQTESVEAAIKKIKLINTSIELVYFGKASIVYYWDRKTKQIDSIAVSD